MLDRLPGRFAMRIIAIMLPPAERAEVVGDLENELTERIATHGSIGATIWIWSQAARSSMALLGRSWSRGTTGFDSHANMMNPGGPIMERWILEARYALRHLRTRPAFATLAILTLAVGIAGLTAIAGVARPLLVDPLPYPRVDQLVQMWRPSDWRGREITALRNNWPGFRGVAGFRAGDVTLERDGAPAKVIPGLSATTELFAVLGVAPMIGRAFATGEDAPGSAPVVVISHSLWSELGADRTLVGKTVRLDGVPRTVIGVMPPGFWFPDPSVGVWAADSLAPDGGVGFYTMVGRVADGQRADHMQPFVDRVTKLLGSQFTYDPRWDLTKNAVLTPLRDEMVGSMRPTLFATVAGMAVILLIACANVAALVLGQVEQRSTELAVRAALGADRGRIATQILMEVLAIGVVASVMGSLLAVGGFDLLRRSLPLGAWRSQATLDWTIFATAIGVALASAAAIALFPVLSLWRRDLQLALSGARTRGVLRRGGLQSPMIVGEVALAVLLASAAGLLVRSVSLLYAVRPGIDVRSVAVLDLATPSGTKPDDRRALMQNILDRVAALPGVQAAASTQRIPLRGSGWSMGLRIVGAPTDAPTPKFRIVSRDYFRALGLPLRRGRLFDATDRATDSIASIVVNDAVVKYYFPTTDPIGQVMPGGFGKLERIVGIVGNAAEGSLTDPLPSPARYYLADQVSFVPSAQTVVIRLERPADAAATLLSARQIIAKTAPSVAVQEATTMSRVFDIAVGPARDVMSLLTLLTSLALVLAAIGIYGVISQFVARRNREWSIRVALGLAPSRVVARIVGHSTALVTLGVLIGVGAAVASGRLLSSFLFGVTAHDPLAVTSAAVALLVVGIAAALIPALRASRTDPALVLREE